jgi:hypothetical protein
VERQTIIVTQNNGGRSGGGCGSVFAVIVVVALAVHYWYISAAVVLIALGAGAWYLSRRGTDASALASPHVAPLTPANGPASVCRNCAAVVRGNFCSECGAAHSLICAHCGQRGLTSPYCPQCGAATYQPPTP